MDATGDRQLSEVHIKDRSLRLARGYRAKQLQEWPQHLVSMAESSRKAATSAIFLRGRYSDRHCKALAAAAWWQSLADARQTGDTTP